MVRTVIALPQEDKDWLDREAAREGVSMTELVRRAVRLLRAETERRESFSDLLAATAGTWTEGDGLEYQRRLRAEWDREPPE